MNTINIEIDEEMIRKLIIDYLNELVMANFDKDRIKVMVKSKQNYSSEWEEASFKVTVAKTLPTTPGV